jgi:hypothetical protein
MIAPSYSGPFRRMASLGGRCRPAVPVLALRDTLRGAKMCPKLGLDRKSPSGTGAFDPLSEVGPSRAAA